MNKPKKQIAGHSWEWVAEYRARTAADRLAFRLRSRGLYVRVVKSESKTYDIYARPGRPWGRPRP